MLLYRLHHLQRVGPRQHHLCGSHGQQRERDAAGGMRHGRSNQVDWMLLVVHACAEVRDHGGEVQVREHHPLGSAGGASRGPNRHHVVRFCRDIGCRRIEPLEPVVQPWVGAIGFVHADISPDVPRPKADGGHVFIKTAVIEKPGAIVAVHDVDVVIERVTRVEWHPRHAGTQQAQDACKGIYVVRTQHCAHHQRLHAMGNQPVCQPMRQLAGFRESQCALAVD